MQFLGIGRFSLGYPALAYVYLHRRPICDKSKKRLIARHIDHFALQVESFGERGAGVTDVGVVGVGVVGVGVVGVGVTGGGVTGGGVTGCGVTE
jgi:hypothetical protein